MKLPCIQNPEQQGMNGGRAREGLTRGRVAALLNITKIKAAIPTLKPDGETLFLIYAEIFEAMVRLGIDEQLIYMANQETLHPTSEVSMNGESSSKTQPLVISLILDSDDGHAHKYQ
jgi:hypothetical protein